MAFYDARILSFAFNSKPKIELSNLFEQHLISIILGSLTSKIKFDGKGGPPPKTCEANLLLKWLKVPRFYLTVTILALIT